MSTELTQQEYALLDGLTAEQIIGVLVARPTFQGVVFYAEGREVLSPGPKPFVFVHSQNLDRDQGLTLMERGVDGLRLKS